MIYLDQKLVKADKEKMDELKKVFPSFFANPRKPVSIRNNEGFSYKAKVGRLGRTMRQIDRPCAGVRITMRAQFYDEANMAMSEIIVSSRPAKLDVSGNLKFDKNDGMMLEHGMLITDVDQLYFLYFYYNGISNNACENKSASPRFSFSMPELEQEVRISAAAEEARTLTAIASSLSDISIADILRKMNVPLSENKGENRDVLLRFFRGDRRAEVVKIVDDVLSVTEEKGSTTKIDIEAVVKEAILNGKLKIEEGKLFLVKKDGTFSTKAEKVLEGEDEDEMFLDAVSYFAGNETKLKQIV